MGAILVVFLLVWVGSGFLGVKLIRFVVMRQRLEEPVIPAARIANTEGAEYAYQKTTDLAARGTRKLGKGLGISLGLLLIVWPIVVVVWFFTVGLGIGSM